jgi:hypothetical protein
MRSKSSRWLILFALAPVVTSACDNSASRSSEVELLNDTGKPVLVWQCKREDCRHDYAGKDELRPGDHFHVGVSTVGVPNPYLVLDPMTQKPLGCLPVVFPKPRGGVIARVSQRVPCQHSYSDKAPWPPNWLSGVIPEHFLRRWGRRR